jgi:SAM-dependent methyltransferase
MEGANSTTPKGQASRIILKAANFARRVMRKIRPPLPLFKALNRGKKKFECPICSYKGPFADLRFLEGYREDALCPSCGALERHRLQYLVVEEVLKHRETQTMAMLHFAPEKFFMPIFSRRFGKYETADLLMKEVNHRVDISSLPFKDETYDFIFASHVLEYIDDDKRALKEIRRVLKPQGLAVLSVPIVALNTIEYPKPNRFEARSDVRAPGMDYFERYKRHFARVDIYSSESFPEKYQLYIFEDRTVWPTKEWPLCLAMHGKKHLDFVPVCYCSRLES